MKLSVLNLSLSLNLIFVSGGLVGWLGSNVETSFNPVVSAPRIAKTAKVHPLAAVTGSVELGHQVFVAPCASVRADEGQNIHIGDQSNVQDGVVVHGLETHESGHDIAENQVEIDGKRYSVYIGQQVSLAHQSQVHGPAKVGDHVFVGMQSLVFRAEIGDRVVIEPGAKIIGVKIPSGRYVPALTAITSQAAADALPFITPDYQLGRLNDKIVHVNTQLADPHLHSPMVAGRKP